MIYRVMHKNCPAPERGCCGTYDGDLRAALRADLFTFPDGTHPEPFQRFRVSCPACGHVLISTTEAELMVTSPVRALQCVCSYPGCTLPALFRHQNTAYVNDAQNWAFMCDGHQEMADEYWQERWHDYYSDMRPYFGNW